MATASEASCCNATINMNEVSGMWRFQLTYSLNGTNKLLFSYFYGWGEVPIPYNSIYKTPIFKRYTVYKNIRNIEPNTNAVNSDSIEEYLNGGIIVSISGYTLTASPTTGSGLYYDYNLTRLEVKPDTSRIYFRVRNTGNQTMDIEAYIDVLVVHNLDIELVDI